MEWGWDRLKETGQAIGSAASTMDGAWEAREMAPPVVRKIGLEDLRQASQRSSNLAEFKTTIQEIRERKEAEREFERNRRTPPPSDKEPTLQPLAP